MVSHSVNSIRISPPTSISPTALRAILKERAETGFIKFKGSINSDYDKGEELDYIVLFAENSNIKFAIANTVTTIHTGAERKNV